MSAKFLVIFPTYNEAGNIRQAVSSALSSGADVLVVDDNSPDGTAGIVERIATSDSRVRLIKRPGKLGLGSAYKEGFDYALKNGYAKVFTMDADLSHPFDKIPQMLASVAELCTGSRYIKGGRLTGWPLHRKLLSRFANMYARAALGAGIRDLTSGFNCISAAALGRIGYGAIESEGYGFLIELKFRAKKSGCSLGEVPIEFRERARGKSKLGKKIIWEAFWLIPRLRFQS